MFKRISNSLLIFALLGLMAACAKERTIYKGLGPDEDGTIAVEIPENDDKPLAPEPKSETNQLSETEKKLVDEWHEGELDKLSFFVVDVATKKVLRNYFGDKPQRLASVSKITTALAALENVRNVEVSKVARMLKNSHNGEASRYVRLSAKALNGTITTGPKYSDKARCPDPFLEDQKAADVVFEWLIEEMPEVDWSDASYNDGAGCNYNNFMTSVQVAKILEYADDLGEAFDGKSFEDLLSINGVDGTWKNRNPDHKGYIFAKTGTLRPNGNLSGYFYAKRNNKFVKHYFSVFVNKKGAGQYSTRARKLIEELVKYWINYYSANVGEPIQDF